MLPQFVSDASALHEVGFDLSISMAHPIVETASPSHAVRAVAQGIGRSRVSLATARDLPNRDLVLDVRTAETLDGILAGVGSDGRGHFVAVVPSAAFKGEAGEGEAEAPRRVVFVLDRSVRWAGRRSNRRGRLSPRVSGALGAEDTFGIVVFDSVVEAFGSGLFKATVENREKARKFLEGIDARGGTELASGMEAAANMLGKTGSGGGGDVMIVTDGQVTGTEAILAVARATGLRLHCLGIGSASQDRFLTLLARETGGVSRFVTPRERVDMGAVELFASVGRPLASGLEVKVEGFGEARIAPEVPAYVFAGTPIVVYGDTPRAGDGRLVFDWEVGGAKRIPRCAAEDRGNAGDGEALAATPGARLITDMESRCVGGESERGVEGKREAERVKKRLVALSQAYGLASREMVRRGRRSRRRPAGRHPGDESGPGGPGPGRGHGGVFRRIGSADGAYAARRNEPQCQQLRLEAGVCRPEKGEARTQPCPSRNESPVAKTMSCSIWPRASMPTAGCRGRARKSGSRRR